MPCAKAMNTMRGIFSPRRVYEKSRVVSHCDHNTGQTKRSDNEREGPAQLQRDCVQPTSTTIHPAPAVAGVPKRSRTLSSLFRSHTVMPGGVETIETTNEQPARDLVLEAVDDRDSMAEVRPVALTSAVEEAILGTDGILASSQGGSSSQLTAVITARRRYSLALMPSTSAPVVRPSGERNSSVDLPVVAAPTAIITTVQSEHEDQDRVPSANSSHEEQGPTGTTAPTANPAHRERLKIMPLILALQRFASPPKTLSSESIREMPWRKRLHLYLEQPESSVLGWRLLHVLMVLLLLNIVIMASQTLDGPRFEGSDPVFYYLPSEASYMAAEAFFTFTYVVEFVARCVAAPSQEMHWKNIHTWVALFALLPWFLITFSEGSSDTSKSLVETRDKIDLLRILRVIRLISLCRVFVGYQVMQKTVVNSYEALKITVRYFLSLSHRLGGIVCDVGVVFS